LTLTALGLVLLGLLTSLWYKTRSLDPEVHARIDSALRELRSLDRTINQDVLRARYQLVDSYYPVLQSYRRIEQAEAVIANPPGYLDDQAGAEWMQAVADYRSAVTSKQNRIEEFKYRSADLKELLNYLPAAGTSVAKAASESGDEQLAREVNHVLQLTLLYNLTSDEKYAPTIREQLALLAGSGEAAHSAGVRRRVRTLVLNIRSLLKVKPEVDRLLTRIFEEPVTKHEETVARVYYRGYAVAEKAASSYRVLLYGLCIALVVLVAYGVRRLQLGARALAVANEKLEERVAERTRELASRNREMRVVLDNVEQALFTVDLQGRLSRERSAATNRWFPHALPDALLWEVFGALDPEAAPWIRLGWDELRDASLPMEVVLDQLPRRLRGEGRHYDLAYLPVGEESRLEKLLLVVSDVTERVEQSDREADQQEQAMVFEQVIKDRAGVLEFLAESQRLIEQVLADTDASSTLRAIHTLKGNSALYGASALSGVCHELETKVMAAGESLDDSDRQSLTQVWNRFAERAKRFAHGSDGRVELSRSDFQSLRRAAGDAGQISELLRLLCQFERERAERRLNRIAEQAKALARRLGKGELLVIEEANNVRLDPKRWAPFWAAFVHVVRNAVEHGIETAEERRALGKPESGRLTLRTKQIDEQVVVELTDDGRGIDWRAVRARARELDWPCETDEDLRAVLFRGGVSTKSCVTEYSGRGAGVNACYQACLALGGVVAITSKAGEGTTFQFRVSSDDALISSLVPAA
jgi:signal transduction histidine kinase